MKIHILPSSNHLRMNPKVPFQHSYWAIPGQLLAGGYPGDFDPVVQEERLTGLFEVGVTLIINLMEESETDNSWKASNSYHPFLANLCRLRGHDVRVTRHPITDFSIPTARDMKVILMAIRAEIAAGGIVYVHCFGGIGRTGTVIGCYLAEQGHPNALEKLTTLTAHETYFSPTPHTEEQRAFVANWRPRC